MGIGERFCAWPPCGKPIQRRSDGKGGNHKRFCSPKCSQTATKARYRGADIPRFNRREDPRELGPEIPLDGVAEAERRRQRNERLMKAWRDGVPADALRERFGDISFTRLGARGKSGEKQLPLGLPL